MVIVTIEVIGHLSPVAVQLIAKSEIHEFIPQCRACGTRGARKDFETRKFRKPHRCHWNKAHKNTNYEQQQSSAEGWFGPLLFVQAFTV